MSRKSLAPFVFVLAISGSWAAAKPRLNRSAKKASPLDEPIVAELRPVYPDIATAFQSVMPANVPGGVATSEGCVVHPRKPLHVTGATLRQALDSIVTEDPQYRWVVDRGVTDLVPTDGPPPLLKTKFGEVEINNPADVWRSSARLFSLPIVLEARAQLGLSIRGTLSAGPPPNLRPLPTLRLDDGSVFRGLNALMRANGGGIWMYDQRSCHGAGDYSLNFWNVPVKLNRPTASESAP
ncbi:MAG: hypothetical protein ACRD10_15245 [Terriglobia bacterium]